METGFRIISVDSPEFSDERWKEYFSLRIKVADLHGSPFKSLSWSAFKKQSLSRFVSFKHHYHVIFRRNDKIVGWSDFFVRNPESPDVMAYPRMEALAEKIPRELAVLLAEWILTLMRRHNLRHIFCNVWRDAWADLITSWNGRSFSRCDEFVLRYDEADRETIAGWKKSGEEENPDLTMAFSESVPEELMEQYMSLLESAIAEIPEEQESGLPTTLDRDEVLQYQTWLKINNMVQYHAFLTDGSGRLIGMSDVSIDRASPTQGSQFMTTVASSHRGRGLAKWLKAAMFEYLGDQIYGLNRLVTWMRSVNEPIQHVNARMGYRKERQGIEYRVPLEGIAEYLQKSR